MTPKPTPAGEVPELKFHDGFIRGVSLIGLDIASELTLGILPGGPKHSPYI